MLVIFLRHGDAESAGDNPGVAADAARRLTPKGRDETAMVVAALDRLHVRPDVVLTSPLVRAMQTAQIAAKKLRKAPDPMPVESLAPGHRWTDVRRAILKALQASDLSDKVVLLCGHQPDLGEYVAEAIAQRPGTGLERRKSSAICVSWEGARFEAPGRVSLALEPRIAKRILKIAGD